MPDDSEVIEHEKLPADKTGMDPTALLLAMGNSGTGAAASVFSQLISQSTDNPQLALVLKLLEQSSAPSAPNSEAIEAVRAEMREEQAEGLRELTTTVERVYSELEVLRARNLILSRALGACPACFGEDLLCQTCSGRGAPGSRAPFANAYNMYVAPAVSRVHRVLRRREFADAPLRQNQTGNATAESTSMGVMK